ncbi:MAG: hypothetical protein JWQ53_585 [Klenkia sp.]|nr:hypothetical protein [Klenkia sp.]
MIGDVVVGRVQDSAAEPSRIRDELVGVLCAETARVRFDA